VASDEVRSATLWWTYRSTKARKQLGFEPRPHEETLEAAVRWQSEQLGERVGEAGAQQHVLGAAGRVWRGVGRVLGR
jgi:hypothetical protein